MRAISLERFSRISGPIRHDDAVMMISSEKTCEGARRRGDGAGKAREGVGRGRTARGRRAEGAGSLFDPSSDLADLDLALVAPLAKVLLGLVDHLGHHRLEALRVHRVHEQLHLLLALLERRVVHDALPEDGDGEAVHGRLVEHLVLRLDELQLRAGADHEGDALRAHLDREHRAVARAVRVDHADGALDEVEQVAEQRHAARDERRRQRRLRRQRRRRRQQRVQRRERRDAAQGARRLALVERVGEQGEAERLQRHDRAHERPAARAHREHRGVQPRGPRPRREPEQVLRLLRGVVAVAVRHVAPSDRLGRRRRRLEGGEGGADAAALAAVGGRRLAAADDERARGGRRARHRAEGCRRDLRHLARGRLQGRD